MFLNLYIDQTNWVHVSSNNMQELFYIVVNFMTLGVEGSYARA